MKTKYFFLSLICIGVLIIVKQIALKNDLYDDYILTQGQIVNYKSSQMRKVEFVFGDIDLKKRGDMVIPFPNCGTKIRQNLVIIKQLNFPVIYAKSDMMNHEILIYKKQYKEIGMEIPDKLKEIVLELSDCSNQK